MSIKITIVTPSYNQGIFIDQTIRSVLDQTYNDLEYIVVDGGSTDDSLKIINFYAENISTIIAEKDKGQSDAINKGFNIATGEVLGWVNSDDVLLPNALNIVGEYFERHPECRWVAGNCLFTDIFLNNGWHYVAKQQDPEMYLKFWDGIFLAQPSVFFRKDLFEEVNGLNLNLHYAMDLDLWLKFLHITPLHILDTDLSINRVYPNTKTSIGKEDSINEIADIILKSKLNITKGYTLSFIKKSLRKSFLIKEKDAFRSDLYSAFKNIGSYKLTVADRLQLFAIVLKRFFNQLIIK